MSAAISSSMPPPVLAPEKKVKKEAELASAVPFYLTDLVEQSTLNGGSIVFYGAGRYQTMMLRHT